MKQHRYLWVLTLSVFVLSILPLLVQDGMTFDGVLYAGISKNLANNLGSFWQPHFSKTYFNTFFQHPPLVFGIQSMFFKVLGNSIYVERLFSFSNAILSLLGIVAIWRLTFKDSKLKRFDWLPVLLWIITPIVSASYRGNLLENTLTVFTLLASYFIIKAILFNNKSLLVIASLFIVFAIFSKGLVGLFPLVIIFIYWICFPGLSFRKSLIFFGILITSLLGLMVLIFLVQPEASNNISQYLNQQLFPALQNELFTRGSHFYILIRLLLELIPSLVVMFLIIIISRKRKKEKESTNINHAVFFFMIGLSASLPLMITLKQLGHYIVPAIPFFAMAISAVVVPNIMIIFTKLGPNRYITFKILVITFILLSITLSVTSIGKSGGADGIIGLVTAEKGENRKKLNDVYILSSLLPEGTVISVPASFPRDIELLAYLGRYGYLSLDWSGQHDYYLTENKEINKDLVSEGYRQIPYLKLNNYKLYQRTKD